ncbi:MAG TPA: hypothetical protein VK977_05330, partial [Actinomycetota bacterium]|nr:hypothetical protein [Actinomycetota bacterium]
MTEAVDEARRRLRSRLGSDLAEKATEGFVLALSRSLSRAPGDLALETLATEMPAAPATVVEFDPRTDLTRRVGEETVARRTEAGGSGGTRLEELGRAADRLEASTDLASRDASVRALREDFHRTCGGVTDTLERSGGAKLRAGMEAFGSGGPTPITYTCWLNRTVRTAADPTTIAEVAGEQAITRIDVPRRIQAEVTKG